MFVKLIIVYVKLNQNVCKAHNSTCKAQQIICKAHNRTCICKAQQNICKAHNSTCIFKVIIFLFTDMHVNKPNLCDTRDGKTISLRNISTEKKQQYQPDFFL